jgi:RNA polymerase sigma-70 factor (ECF subfamily)
LVAEEIEIRLRMLMIAALAGDATAYRQLLSSASDRLRRYFGRRLGADSADVEDLVQETLMAIHQRRDSYDRSLPFTSWLHGIARYKLVDLYRRRGVGRAVPVEDFDDFVGDDSMEPALAAFDVDALLANLPEKQRVAIRLTRVEGYSISEASDMTGQSESAIKIGVHRGVKRLSARVKGFEPE